MAEVPRFPRQDRPPAARPRTDHATSRHPRRPGLPRLLVVAVVELRLDALACVVRADGIAMRLIPSPRRERRTTERTRPARLARRRPGRGMPQPAVHMAEALLPGLRVVAAPAALAEILSGIATTQKTGRRNFHEATCTGFRRPAEQSRRATPRGVGKHRERGPPNQAHAPSHFPPRRNKPRRHAVTNAAHPDLSRNVKGG
jgi:hypothetical protein